MENKKIKILLAEDDPNLGTILKAYLEAKGFPVKLAVNGVEAHNMFLKETFDFCIFDVMMPKKMGLPLQRISAKLTKKFPFFF
jgi:DNA-binding response OmpR family regulator